MYLLSISVETQIYTVTRCNSEGYCIRGSMLGWGIQKDKKKSKNKFCKTVFILMLNHIYITTTPYNAFNMYKGNRSVNSYLYEIKTSFFLS